MALPVVMVTHASGQTLRGMLEQEEGATVASLVPGDWTCREEDGPACLTDGSEQVCVHLCLDIRDGLRTS